MRALMIALIFSLQTEKTVDSFETVFDNESLRVSGMLSVGSYGEPERTKGDEQK